MRIENSEIGNPEIREIRNLIKIIKKSFIFDVMLVMPVLVRIQTLIVKRFIRCFSCSDTVGTTLRVVIVGAGPGGFYTAHQLLKVIV